MRAAAVRPTASGPVRDAMPLSAINEAFDLMHEGKSIRSVVHF
jgi:Zn-dependent alcohol dehydrogenase